MSAIKTASRPRHARPLARGPWTSAELEWLRANFATSSLDHLLAGLPDKGEVPILSKAIEMGLVRPKCPEYLDAVRDAVQIEQIPAPFSLRAARAHLVRFDAAATQLSEWTEPQLQQMHQLAARRLSIKQMRDISGKAPAEIEKALLFLGYSTMRPARWTADQEQALATSFKQGGPDFCVQQFSHQRGRSEINARLICMGLRPRRPRTWHVWQTNYLVFSVLRHRHIDEIAYSLFRSRAEVFKKALDLGCARTHVLVCLRPLSRAADGDQVSASSYQGRP